MLRWQERLGPAVVAGTGRSGGVGSGAYSSLNLGDHVGDDPAVVRHNRAVVAGTAGVEPGRLVFAQQVHGTRVVGVSSPWDGPVAQADALLTRTPGLALGVLVADCTPVLVVAPDEGVVGVAHAGRRGMADGVVPALVEAMRDSGATRLQAWVGPSICARCYEVPLALREEVAAAEPVARSVTRSGTPALDVAGGVIAQLAGLGVGAVEVAGCTRESDELFSYRRESVTGRFAGLAWLPA